MTPPPGRIVLAVCGGTLDRRDGKWYAHHSFGRVVDALAARVKEVRYCGPTAVPAHAFLCNYSLARDNVAVYPGPCWANSLQALKRPDRVVHAYRRAIKGCDALFLRGSLPLLWTVHLMSLARRVPIVHWVVGNPVAILKGAQRGYGAWLTALGLQYAYVDRALTRLAIGLTRAHVLANGAELARLYRTPRTHEVVSTSISEEDFHSRADTCTGPLIRLLFVGFVRPEKGLEFLLRAMPLIETDRPVHLSVVGAWEQFAAERERLLTIINELHLGGRVRWEGYVSFGRALFDKLDDADVLVLPSLSEGTPRVLVEARARSLPLVATNVGGIPSSVTDGEDGLLVPPRDAPALARAVSRIINDARLRRRLIRTGRDNVRGLTVERFADRVVELLAGSRDAPPWDPVGRRGRTQREDAPAAASMAATHE